MTVREAIDVLENIIEELEDQYGEGADINLVYRDKCATYHNGINITLDTSYLRNNDKIDSFPTINKQKIVVAAITSSN